MADEPDDREQGPAVRSGVRADRAAAHAEEAADEAQSAAAHAEQVAADADEANGPEEVDDSTAYLHDTPEPVEDLGEPGRPLNHRSPFLVGFFGAAGALVAFWLGVRLLQIGPVLILIVVAMFLAVGLNPAVELLMRRGLKRPWAVLLVTIGVVLAIALFVFAIAPIVSTQVTRITDSAPDWLSRLQHARWVRDLDSKYDVIDKIKSYATGGELPKQLFGGVLGIGLALISFLGNAFVVTVLTLYFLASLPSIKRAAYQLAPSSRRDRVSLLGDQILRNIGGYVSGAFIVAFCAGLSTLVFLFIVGMGQYAVALALVVALLDVIPMIGATLGAVIVCAIGFATDVKTGIICVIFYVLYQQMENYVLYPRVMQRSVDIPGALTVIAALIGASLLGVVGALLAIPTAAAVLLLVKEVFLPRQDVR